ncbi:hypothetical protein Sango_3109600 [Sesamum angolense]|uniref:Uncharacterized protein n=1 Tax=Sesamum angolense TaxID=2727404 RepID=A0AAE1W104_9LAMI|nr:hypothetical protein Sango_3109600 [Sesamum angolense]
MEWRKCYLDLILVPLGFMICMGYQVWLWHKVRTHPFSTVIGRNAHGRRFWVSCIIKDNDKKNILAVQTLRNAIMGSTLMASTSILLCTAWPHHQQHLQREEAYKGHRLRRARRVHGGAEVNFLINCPPESGNGRGDGGVRGGASGAGVRAEHGGKQAVLQRGAAAAVDIWAGAGVHMFGDDGAAALQFGLCIRC